jgi:acyl-CoA-binding protein
VEIKQKKKDFKHLFNSHGSQTLIQYTWLKQLVNSNSQETHKQMSDYKQRARIQPPVKSWLALKGSSAEQGPWRVDS